MDYAKTERITAPLSAVKHSILPARLIQSSIPYVRLTGATNIVPESHKRTQCIEKKQALLFVK